MGQFEKHSSVGAPFIFNLALYVDVIILNFFFYQMLYNQKFNNCVSILTLCISLSSWIGHILSLYFFCLIYLKKKKRKHVYIDTTMDVGDAIYEKSRKLTVCWWNNRGTMALSLDDSWQRCNERKKMPQEGAKGTGAGDKKQGAAWSQRGEYRWSFLDSSYVLEMGIQGRMQTAWVADGFKENCFKPNLSIVSKTRAERILFTSRS